MKRLTPPTSLSPILLGALLARIRGFGQIPVSRIIAGFNRPVAGEIPLSNDLIVRCLHVLRLFNIPSSLFIGLMAFVFVPRPGASPRVHFQSTAVLQGRVLDQNGAVVPRAQISAQNNATGLARTGETDSDGNYQIAALPVGNYRVEVKAGGFRNRDR